jgi:hypothetical protein
MISDPVIATEVLNRRDFDKEWQVYKSISKVQPQLRHSLVGTCGTLTATVYAYCDGFRR